MENDLFNSAVLTLLTTVTCISPFYCNGIHESLVILHRSLGPARPSTSQHRLCSQMVNPAIDSDYKCHTDFSITPLCVVPSYIEEEGCYTKAALRDIHIKLCDNTYQQHQTPPVAQPHSLPSFHRISRCSSSSLHLSNPNPPLYITSYTRCRPPTTPVTASSRAYRPPTHMTSHRPIPLPTPLPLPLPHLTCHKHPATTPSPPPRPSTPWTPQPWRRISKNSKLRSFSPAAWACARPC